jgi:hypothetical protein
MDMTYYSRMLDPYFISRPGWVPGVEGSDKPAAPLFFYLPIIVH